MPVYFAIDLKSFYASVECVDRNLDPFNTPLVVADKSRGDGTIVMAVSPYLKSLGIPSRLRLYQLKPVKGTIVARPRMSRYIEVSTKIVSIYLKYVNYIDLHIYSIDEVIMDVTRYLNLYKLSPKALAKKIIDDIYKASGLTVTCGIGDNMFLAKVAMDIEAKHKPSNIAYWKKKDVISKLWPITSFQKVWSIGANLERKLHNMGFYSLGDIALADKSYLKDKLGVIGEELHDHVNGIDNSDIREKYIPSSKSLSVGQVLFSDYTYEEGKLLIKEMSEELLIRLIASSSRCKKLHLSVGYSKRGGFSKSLNLENPSDIYSVISQGFLKLYDSYFDKDQTMRTICLASSDLSSSCYYQISLFEDYQGEAKEREGFKAVLKIKEKFGEKSVFKASNLLEKSTALRRMDQIGGHRK